MDFIKKHIVPFLYKYVAPILIITSIMVLVLYLLLSSVRKDTITSVEKIEYVDTLGTYHKIYAEEDFKALKNENKALYDSLKKYKDQIDYLVKFKVKNDYSTGTVYTSSEDADTTVESHTFEYTNEPNDTMRYKLKINSEKEPNWYSLDITTNNEYTIINKSYDDGTNHITIDGNGEVSDVTVFKRKEKRGFWNRFSIGPGVTVGYDPINNRFGTTVGVSVSFDLK